MPPGWRVEQHSWQGTLSFAQVGQWKTLLEVAPEVLCGPCKGCFTCIRSNLPFSISAMAPMQARVLLEVMQRGVDAGALPWGVLVARAHAAALLCASGATGSAPVGANPCRHVAVVVLPQHQLCVFQAHTGSSVARRHTGIVPGKG
jgi:hypothetical protein